MVPLALQALLFDLDGTLIHSMPLHAAAWRQWHRRHGLALDEATFFTATAGRTNAEILADLFPGAPGERIAAMAEEKEALYREQARQHLERVAGSDALLADARARGLKLAICTASPPGNMAVAFERFGLDRQVDTITAPHQGLRGKPHPDIFVEAARRLGVDARACLVFEDAPLGIEAAQRAGMRAVALTTTLPAQAFAGFDNIVATTADFRGFDLGPLLAPQTEDHPHA